VIGTLNQQALELVQHARMARRDHGSRLDLVARRQASPRNERTLVCEPSALGWLVHVSECCVDHADRVAPCATAVQQAAQRPRVRRQRRIELERTAIRMKCTLLASELPLVELAELVRKNRSCRGILLAHRRPSPAPQRAHRRRSLLRRTSARIDDGRRVACAGGRRALSAVGARDRRRNRAARTTGRRRSAVLVVRRAHHLQITTRRWWTQAARCYLVMGIHPRWRENQSRRAVRSRARKPTSRR